jgi:hypothetical protein
MKKDQYNATVNRVYVLLFVIKNEYLLKILMRSSHKSAYNERLVRGVCSWGISSWKHNLQVSTEFSIGRLHFKF